MKKIHLLFLFVTSVLSAQNLESEKQKVTQFLDQWHAAAAAANFETYFGALAEESIFIGTDATENWNKKQFQAFAKPYFDKGKAWNFKAIERNIYFSENGKVVWFDEIADANALAHGAPNNIASDYIKVAAVARWSDPLPWLVQVWRRLMNRFK